MNLITDLFLAWRYLRPKRNAVSVITCISIIGVILGVAVLIVVISVMAGFTDEIKKKLLETTAHIQITNRLGYITSNDTERIIDIVESCGAKASPIVFKHALLQSGESFLPKIIIGIDPERANEGIKLSKVINDGKYSLNRGEILISTEIEDELSLDLGDKIIIHSPAKLAKMVKVEDDGKINITENAKVYLPSEFKISGLFSFGKYDFDKNVIFINLDDADELFDLPWGYANVMYVVTKDPFNMKNEVEYLKNKLIPEGYRVRTWKEQNGKLIGVLEVEKNMMFFLLIFIVLVAAFSITNTLITVVVQKTREIGLIKALGAQNISILNIFLIQGFIVGVLGTFFGTIMGLAIIHWRNGILFTLRRITGQELFPREFYNLNQLPATVNHNDLLIIALVSIALCTLGGLIPAWRAARLDPAKALRYE